MKRLLNNRIFLVLMTAIIVGSIGVYAGSQILASDISYRDGTVESALNDLYDKANSTGTVCIKQSGTSLAVSAKYLCELGDGVARNFYVLAVNGDTVKMIMEKNLSDEITGSSRTMIYADALAYFDEGNSGYATKQAWNKVQSVDLPDAQDIANAGGMNNGTTTQWNVNTATQDNWAYFGTNSQSNSNNITDYKWLYNYTRGCKNRGNCDYEYPESDTTSAYGYWTKDLLINSDSSAWVVSTAGKLDFWNINSSAYVRPVITLSKSKLVG